MVSRTPIKIGAIKLQDFSRLFSSSILSLAVSIVASCIVGIIAYNGYVLGTYTGTGNSQMFYWIAWNSVSMIVIYSMILYSTFQVLSGETPRAVLNLVKRFKPELIQSGFLCVMLSLVTGMCLATLYMDESSFTDRQRVMVSYLTIIVGVVGCVFSTLRSYSKFGGQSLQDMYLARVGRIEISASGRVWDRAVSFLSGIHLIHFMASIYILVIGMSIGSFLATDSEPLTGLFIILSIGVLHILFLAAIKIFDMTIRRTRRVKGEKYSPRGIEFFDQKAYEDNVGDVTSFNMDRKRVLRAKEKFDLQGTL